MIIPLLGDHALACGDEDSIIKQAKAWATVGG